MLKLVQLSVKDKEEVYNMLQRIKANENEFTNGAYGLSYDDFKKWLIQQDNWSRGVDLPEGYVPQFVYWLFDEDIPVGIGKIRLGLNEQSRKLGGNIGYAIDPLHRGKGYATILLGLLLKKARELEVNEILLTVEKSNPSSRRVIEKNGGVLVGENELRWYYTA